MPELLTDACVCGHDIYDHEFIYHPEEKEWHRSHDQPDEIGGCEVDDCTCTKYTEAE